MDLVALTGEALIHDTEEVAEDPAGTALGHDAEAHFIRHENDVARLDRAPMVGPTLLMGGDPGCPIRIRILFDGRARSHVRDVLRRENERLRMEGLARPDTARHQHFHGHSRSGPILVATLSAT